MNTLRSFTFLVILFAVGCDFNWVTVSARIGSKVEASKLKDVVGRWCDQENGIMELRVSRKGELVAGNMSWDEQSDKFASESVAPDIRELGGNVFLFAAEEEQKAIFLLILRPDVDKIELYLPEPAMFRDAVEIGAVAGEIVPKRNEHFCVNLTADAKLESFLSAKDSRKYFQKEPLLVYDRAKLQK